MTTTYLQRSFSLAPRKRGCHLITSDVVRQLQHELGSFSVGLCVLFIQHTSASLTLNENADSTVRSDMEDALNRLAPVSSSYRHDAEGDDDMPAHIKASVLGSSVTIPITDGQLALGTWQGVWLCEHRDRGGSRSFVATLHGLSRGGGGGGSRHGDGK